jgi:hypothetical protein
LQNYVNNLEPVVDFFTFSPQKVSKMEILHANLPITQGRKTPAKMPIPPLLISFSVQNGSPESAILSTRFLKNINIS